MVPLSLPLQIPPSQESASVMVVELRRPSSTAAWQSLASPRLHGHLHRASVSASNWSSSLSSGIPRGHLWMECQAL
jgi:hypothetical protein